MCVAILLRNHRSCEMTSATPFHDSSASSSARRVVTSRSFVGSSSINTFPPAVSVFASCRRFRSPPDKSPTFFCWSEDLKLYHEQYALEFTVRVPKETSSAPPVSSSNTDLPLSSESRDWSTYISFTVSPTTTFPASGSSTPVIILNNVVFPAPFAPTMPTTAPGGIMQSRPSMRSPLPSYPLETFSTLITVPPKRGAAGIVIESRSARAENLLASSHRSSYLRRRALPFFCCPLAFERTQSSSWLIVLASESCFFPSCSRRFDLLSSHDE
mmetsp:Transcript_6152/g.22501  ORF Transcript_6152/g.22501 Transcript_6152/m.22501 type:complete len:271 (-) Transcript_6152:171-983(-)